nr:hypothetical protein [Tanacetum cinerariifolium]
MDTTIDQQVAMDEALVPHAHRLRIGRRNFSLLSDISSKESTLQLEFWATATVHHHSIRFKMDNKKHIVNLESFREMLHICPRLPSQSFVKPSFEEEILAFLRFLGHSEAIRRLTDVNINKLHQPWRLFAAIINKCLTGKNSSYDSLRLSQAQILWELYHKRNVDFAYLMWEDFVYQVEHKDTKKSNEMYYPRDDHMFTTIKLVSRHQNTQQFGAMLPIELTNADIRNSDAYKEYYAVATGATPPKTKANEGTITIPWVLDVPTDESEEEISWNPTDEEGDDDDDEGDDGDDGEEGNDDAQDDDAQDDDDQEDKGMMKMIKRRESFDLILKTPENTDDEGNGEGNLGMNVGREEGQDEEDEEDELYKDININLGKGIQMGDVHTTQEFKDSHVTLTSINPDGQQQSSFVSSQFVTMASLPVSAPTLTPSTITTITITQQAPTPSTTAPSTLLQDLPNFGSLFEFDHRLKTLERNLYKAFVEAYESDKIILDTYRDTVTLKRRCDDDVDKDEEPSAGSDRGSKRRREGKEPDESATTEEPMQNTFKMEEPSHPKFEIGADNQPIVEPSQHPEWFSQQKKPPTPNRDWNKTLPATHGSIQPWISELAKQSDSRSSFNELMDTPMDFSTFLMNRLKVDTLTPELLAGKLANLTVEERFAFNVSLRMFTRSIVIQRHVEDLQLGVESYQKKLNLTRPDTYRSDLKCKEAYIAYSNPRGFIYHNKDNKNRLMQIDELYKFSDETLTDVHTALDDRLKGIQMKYLPQSI